MTTSTTSISTAGLTRGEWLSLRRRGIGGSDVAAILGLSKWRTPLDVYRDKIGEGAEQPDSPAMEWGRRLEPVIREKYAEATGLSVDKPDLMLISGEHPYMIADLDGICSDGRLLEIKTARSGDGWGEPGTDEIPEYYMTQAQHYMAVTGTERCDVAVLIGATDFRIYCAERDQELIDMLIQAEAAFWLTHVVARVPPAPTTAADVRSLYADDDGELAEATNDEAVLIGELKTARARLKELEAETKALESKLIVAIGARAGLTIGGEKAVTYKTQTSRRFSAAAFKAEAPADTYAKYATETKTRVLRIA